MEIDDIEYDIDNVDVEEEMLQRDIAEEEEQIEQEQEQLAQDEVEKKYKKNRMVLNAKNLAADMKLKNERDRVVYKWKKKNGTTKYTGYVVYKFDEDAYIFEVIEDGQKTARKFRLSEITQV